MERKEILESTKFKNICDKFGLNWVAFDTYDNVIVVPDNDKKIMFLFDENYNIINIHKLALDNANLSPSTIVKHYYDLYSSVNNEMGITLPYPFQNLSIKDIMDIADRIEVVNNKYCTYPTVNGKDVSNTENNDFLSLLMYTKFLSEEIDRYYEKLFENMKLDNNYKNIYAHLNQVINIINSVVDERIQKGKFHSLINTSKVLAALGRLNTLENQQDSTLISTIGLIQADKAYKIEQTDSEKQDIDYLPSLVNKLLEIPKYPKELIGIDFGTEYSSDTKIKTKLPIKSTNK